MCESDVIRILIADDNALVREGLAAILTPRHQMEVIAQAANGSEAVKQYRLYRPDITLMDRRMPKMDGLEATRTILLEFPEARIIMLTAFDGEEEAARLAGVKAFVLKETPQDALYQIIRDVFCALPPERCAS